MVQYFLMKAEPDSRVVKGKDVKFSVDDFESMKTSPWDGVRSHEAKNLIRDMKLGDKILFYHSNCKLPGVAGFAEVAREAYPDFTAWDPLHPYYDAKTDKDNPKWYMIDATFVSRASHFIPLSLFRSIASLSSVDPPEEIDYIGKEGVKGIKDMDLVVRGRLSVQRVNPAAYKAVELLAQKGGWPPELLNGDKKAKGPKQTSRKLKKDAEPSAPSRKRKKTENHDSSEPPVRPTRSSKRIKSHA